MTPPEDDGDRVVSTDEVSRRRRARDFISSAKGMVLTAGTLASAVGAVMALVPKHHPTPAPSVLDARFDDLTAYPDVSLDQYDARSAGSDAPTVEGAPSEKTHTGAASIRLLASTSPPRESPGTLKEAVEHSSNGEPPAANGSTTTTSTSSSSSSQVVTTLPATSTPLHVVRHRPEGSGSDSDTATGGDASTPSGDAGSSVTAFRHVEGALVKTGADVPSEKVTAVVEALTAGSSLTTSQAEGGGAVVLPSACKTSCGATQEIEQALTDDPNPVKAAAAVAKAFANSRAEVIAHTRHPIGVAVSYTVDLEGFANSKATLKWSLWSARSNRPLPRRWWRDVIVAQIKPTVSHESISGEFWVPVPPKHGDYFVHLTLYDSNGVPHAKRDTRPLFH